MKKCWVSLQSVLVFLAFAVYTTAFMAACEFGDSLPSFTVSFHANGGEGAIPSQMVSAGSAITLPDSTGFSKDGFVFAGWNTMTDGRGAHFSYGASFAPAENITLFARWDPATTVTFNVNGGTGTIPAQTVGEGLYITLPSGDRLSKSGFIFVGWNENASGTGINHIAGTQFTPVGNTTLFARWLPPVYGNTITDSLAWLQDNAQGGGDYIIQLTANEDIAPLTLNFDNRNITIILHSAGAMRTVNLSSNGNLFAIGQGVTLILDNNVSLNGRPNNNASLIRVKSGGTLIMNTGANITGNTNTSTNDEGTGGVIVNNGGTFTMLGGRIFNNSGSDGSRGNDGSAGAAGNPGSSGSSGTSGNVGGTGGVSVNGGGRFTMYAGRIYNNTGGHGGNGGNGGIGGRGNNATSNFLGILLGAGANGAAGGNGGVGGTGGTGGVNINSGGIFVMRGGEITGNNGGVGGRGGNGGDGGRGGSSGVGYFGRNGGRGGDGGHGGNGGTGGVSGNGTFGVEIADNNGGMGGSYGNGGNGGAGGSGTPSGSNGAAGFRGTSGYSGTGNY